MQISSFLRRGGLTVWVLIAVPVLAMLAAGFVAADAEPTYRTVATVVVTPPSGAAGGVALSQAVEGFESALRTDVVVQEAAAAAGVTPAAVMASTSSRRLGSSSVVEVIYDGPRRDDVDLLLTTQAKGAVRLLFGGEVGAAQAARDSAKERMAAATAALDALKKETGVLLPDEAYRAKAGEVTSLRIAVAQAEARLLSTAALSAALARAETELRDVAAKVNRFEEPQAAVERARADLSDADARLTDVQTRLTSSESPALLRVGAGRVQPSTTSAVRTVVSAGVVGLMIAIASMFVLDRAALLHRPVAGAGGGTQPDRSRAAGAARRWRRPQRSLLRSSWSVAASRVRLPLRRVDGDRPRPQHDVGNPVAVVPAHLVSARSES